MPLSQAAKLGAAAAAALGASVYYILATLGKSTHDVDSPAQPHDLFPEYFVNGQGLRIFTRAWPAERPKARVLIVHGFAEHNGAGRRRGDLGARRGGPSPRRAAGGPGASRSFARDRSSAAEGGGARPDGIGYRETTRRA